MPSTDKSSGFDGRELCLDPLTVLDCAPEETVAIAAEAGCPHLSFWVEPPGPDFPVACLVRPGETADRVKRSLAAAGVRARNLEVYMLGADSDVPGFRPSLETGAELGAVGATALLRPSDPQGLLDRFVELCQLAAALGLRVNAEFAVGSALGSLTQALDFVARADQPNAGVVVDLLHVTRSGSTIQQLKDADPSLVGHAQLCDGPATIDPAMGMAEAAFNRMVPGDGEFQVRAFWEALPPDVPVGLEVPARSTALQGLTPLERVQRIIEGARRAVATG